MVGVVGDVMLLANTRGTNSVGMDDGASSYMVFVWQ